MTRTQTNQREKRCISHSDVQMLNHGQPASLYCKKTVPKQYQELGKAIKLENSGCRMPDPDSRTMAGHAAPRCPGVGKGAGLGSPQSPLRAPSSPALPHRGGAGRDNHRTGWRRLPPLPLRSPRRGQPGSPWAGADRTAPPARPAAFPGGLRSGPGQDRGEGPSGAAAQPHSPRGAALPPRAGLQQPPHPDTPARPRPAPNFGSHSTTAGRSPERLSPLRRRPCRQQPPPAPRQVSPPGRCRARQYLGQAAGEAQPGGAEGCPAGGDGRPR